MTREFASDAWLLKGITASIPGRLECRNDRLRFVTSDEVVFDVPFSDITSVTYPWYYFGGGLKLRAGGQPFRISFVKPNGAEYGVGRALGEAGNPAALLVAASKVVDARTGRAVGRKWRELLGVSGTPARVQVQSGTDQA
jgi:hypothetical protein